MRTIPTECYPDASDDGTQIKSQETILVCVFLSLSLCQTYSVNGKIAGSSIRDESMYTTITQKQSIESMTVSQYQSIKLSNHNTIKFQSNVISGSGPTAMASRAHIAETRSNNNNKIGPIIKCSSSDADTYHPDFIHDKINEIRISISCTNKTKMKNPSRMSQMFHGLFSWRQNIRNVGYYSPPMEHPIDKISIRLDTCGIESNDDAGHSFVANNNTKSKAHIQSLIRPSRNGDDNDGDENDIDSISNSSLKDCNATALEDELTMYMNELKLRELR